MIIERKIERQFFRTNVEAIAGPMGSGKSKAAMQEAIDAAVAGDRVLILLWENDSKQYGRIFHRELEKQGKTLSKDAHVFVQQVKFESGLDIIKELVDRDHYDVIIVDGIQGIFGPGNWVEAMQKYGTEYRHKRFIVTYQTPRVAATPYVSKLITKDAMTLKEYQEKAMATAIYDEKDAINYTALGLGSEAGEVQGKVKKMIRDDKGVLTDERRKAISKELGDVLWYCAALAKACGLNLEDVARENLEKLADRGKRDAIKGDGDDR